MLHSTALHVLSLSCRSMKTAWSCQLVSPASAPERRRHYIARELRSPRTRVKWPYPVRKPKRSLLKCGRTLPVHIVDSQTFTPPQPKQPGLLSSTLRTRSSNEGHMVPVAIQSPCCRLPRCGSFGEQEMSEARQPSSYDSCSPLKSLF